MVHWNQEGFKVGHCYQPPLNQPYSVLNLSNTTSTRHILERLEQKFMKIYKQKVFVHHYDNFMDGDARSYFDECHNNCLNTIASYSEMEFKQEEDRDMTSEEFIDQYRFKPII